MISTSNSPAGSGLSAVATAKAGTTSGAVPGAILANKAGHAQPPTEGNDGKLKDGLATAFAQLVAALTQAAEQQPAPEQTAKAASATEAASEAAEQVTEEVTHYATGHLQEQATGTAAKTETSAVASAGATSATSTTPGANPAASAALAAALGAGVKDSESSTDASKADRKAGAAQANPQQAAVVTTTQLQSTYSSAISAAKSEAGEAADQLRQSSGAAAQSSVSLQLLSTRQDAKELLTAALNVQRGAQPAAPIASGSEVRLDAVQQLARAGQAEWAPVKVDTQNSQWSRDLVAALGDRLSMQINQNVKEATVRLDPPDMGRIELVVRMDGDRLNVQLNASNTGVRDLLTQHAERLRNDLLQQNLQTVDVQVGQQSQRDNSGRYQPEPDTIAVNNIREPEQEMVAEDNSNRWLSTSA